MYLKYYSQFPRNVTNMKISLECIEILLLTHYFIGLAFIGIRGSMILKLYDTYDSHKKKQIQNIYLPK